MRTIKLTKSEVQTILKQHQEAFAVYSLFVSDISHLFNCKIEDDKREMFEALCVPFGQTLETANAAAQEMDISTNEVWDYVVSARKVYQWCKTMQQGIEEACYKLTDNNSQVPVTNPYDACSNVLGMMIDGFELEGSGWEFNSRLMQDDEQTAKAMFERFVSNTHTKWNDDMYYVVGFEHLDRGPMFEATTHKLTTSTADTLRELKRFSDWTQDNWVYLQEKQASKAIVKWATQVALSGKVVAPELKNIGRTSVVSNLDCAIKRYLKDKKSVDELHFVNLQAALDEWYFDDLYNNQ